MSSEIDYYTHLASIMYRTRGCRFGAASALEVKQRWSLGTVAFLSTYLIAWSIVLLAYPEAFTSKHAAFYNTMSATASIALLVVSLMDYALDRSVQAEKLHQNALSISKLMRELERELASQAPNLESMKAIAVEYERSIAETQVNHTLMDYKRWKYSSAKPIDFISRAWFPVRRNVYDVWFYVSSMILYWLLIATIVLPTAWYTWRYVLSGSL
jgi:conflict system pore-forming effector with SLATT domain